MFGSTEKQELSPTLLAVSQTNAYRIMSFQKTSLRNDLLERVFKYLAGTIYCSLKQSFVGTIYLDK